MVHQIFDLIGSPILWLVFICLFIVEKKFQLRKRVQQISKRLIINFLVAIPAFALLRILLIPEMVWLAVINQKLHFGLNYFLHLPYWLANIVAFFLLDYTNYLWHILNHKIPLLWRFHLVHHTD